MEDRKTPATLLERYGRAILRLEEWEWADAIGAKPDGFDSLPIEQRMEIIKPHLAEAREVVGPVVESYFRHMVDQHGEENDWLEFRKWESQREKRAKESAWLYAQEELNDAYQRIDDLEKGVKLSLGNVLFMLLGFAIGVLLV